MCVILVLALASCRKAEPLQLIVRGQVTDFRNNAPVQGVNVRIDEQALQGGALSGAFSMAGQTTTGPDGTYELAFERKNALNYRLRFRKEGYFDEFTELNPDLLRPNSPHDLDAVVKPEAVLLMKFKNVNAESDNELMRFRKLNALFDCACCNNDFIDIIGNNLDTTMMCKLYGDHMLSYTYVVYREEQVDVVDSVYCPAFHTTELVINY